MAHLWEMVVDGVRDHSMLYRPGGDREPVRLADVLTRAERTAAAIVTELAGRVPGRVGLLMANGEPWLRSFFAVLRLDATAVPMPLPVGFDGYDAYVAHLLRLATDAGLDVVLVDRDFGPRTLARVGAALAGAVRVIDVSTLDDVGPAVLPTILSGERPAVIQYTSGSTSRPRGAVISHANVAASLAVMAERTELTEHERLGVWLPLYHDMGLFSLLSVVTVGGSVALWRPGDFVRAPMAWLSQFAALRGTGLPGPNFFFDYLVDAAGRDGIPEGLDLSSWRFAINGAEPVQLRTIETFAQTFAPYGLRADVVRPAYGMAEATLMVSCPRPGTPVRALRVDRDALNAGDPVEVVAAEHPRGRGVVSCGQPVPALELRIADDHGQLYPAGTIGEVQLCGPAVTSGYLGIAAAEQPFTADGWLRTGDLAFLHEDELYPVGRIKDVIIVRGQNFYAEDVEEIVRGTPGADRRTCVALAWIDDSGERMVVLWETRLTGAEADAVAVAMRERIHDQLGLAGTQIVVVAPATIPHTTSGKVRRGAALQLCRARNLLPSTTSTEGAAR